ncbi:MAG: energy-coupling factor transporter transmembrane component T family protein [Spirochaetota bacterium]
MALESLFHYRAGTTALHMHHPLFKTAEMCLLAAAFGSAAPVSCGILALLTAVLFYRIGIGPVELLRDLLRFSYLVGMVMFAAYVTQSGGMHEQWTASLATGLRFTGYILTGMLFTALTPPSQVAGTVYALLRPVPFVSAGYPATFVRIVLALIPVVFETMGSVQSAVRSRFVSMWRRPLRYARYVSYSLTVNSFLHAADFSDALESRGYDAGKFRWHMPVRKRDIGVFGLFLCVIGAAVYGDRIIEYIVRTGM